MAQLPVVRLDGTRKKTPHVVVRMMSSAQIIASLYKQISDLQRRLRLLEARVVREE